MIPKLLPIARMGHPILRQVAEPVDLNKLSEANKIVQDMLYTLKSFGDRIGLAAPQVHISQRIVIFNIPKIQPSLRYDFDCEEVPFTAMLNPEITILNDKKIKGWEGCISALGLMGEVERHESICYTFYDLNGKKHEREAHGFHARVVQHECDHLDGFLFPMRVTDMNRFGFEEEVIKFLKNKKEEVV